MDYQLIVIGAGPGGYTAALQAASMGIKTALIESRQIGGTCLNRGCVPTKTLLHASGLYREAVSGAAFGVHADALRVDMGEIFAYKRHISETLTGGVRDMLKRAKVEVLSGAAVVLAPGEVGVTAEDGTQTVLHAEKILCATGSVPARPPIPGLELDGVITSDELLAGCDRLYRSVVIMGGGVIGVEFACFYADLGCEVTVLEGADRLLPLMDKELGQNLALILKKQGVRVLLGSMVERIEKGADGMTVSYTAKDGAASVSGEVVLCAIGRRPNTEHLFADGLSPRFNGRSLWVDERFETSIPGVYAIGDVSTRIQLAHVAAAEGKAFADIHFGQGAKTDLRVVPSCIYCHPEIASVGLTEAEAKAEDIPVKVGKAVLGGNARTLIADDPRSFVKIVAHAESGEILGAHLMCENSSDMISQFSLAIANRRTADELLRIIRPHPSFEETVGDALEELCRKLRG